MRLHWQERDANSHGVPGKSPRESWVLDVRATKSHTR